MAKIPQEVQELFNQVSDVAFCTANADGQPNANIIAMKKIVDDETLYLSDQFFNKTLANLKVNQKVSVLFWDKGTAYQIYGTARYVNEGAEFTEQAAWVNAAFEQMGMPIKAKGGVYLTVTAVYSSSAGPDAGKQLA